MVQPHCKHCTVEKAQLHKLLVSCELGGVWAGDYTKVVTMLEQNYDYYVELRTNWQKKVGISNVHTWFPQCYTKPYHHWVSAISPTYYHSFAYSYKM